MPYDHLAEDMSRCLLRTETRIGCSTPSGTRHYCVRDEVYEFCLAAIKSLLGWRNFTSIPMSKVFDASTILLEDSVTKVVIPRGIGFIVPGRCGGLKPSHLQSFRLQPKDELTHGMPLQPAFLHSESVDPCAINARF